MKVTDKEFDESIRRICESVEMVPDAGGWNRIEKAMVRRNRITWIVRGCSAAAVAAAVAVGIFILPSGNTSVVTDFPSADAAAPLAVVQQIPESREPAVQVSSGLLQPVPAPDAAIVPEARTDEQVNVAVVDACAAPSDSMNVLPAEKEQDSVVDNPETGKTSRKEVSLEEQIREAEYLAFAADEEKPKKRSFSIDASSDMYTLFGSGNVSFSRRSMSGGAGSDADFVIKPLNGEYPSHTLPISVGIGLRYSFGRFGIGTGVNYTYMKSSYEALVYDYDYYPAKTYQASVDQSVHYIGIPVMFLCDIITSEKLSFYASAGGMVEKGFGLKYRLMTLDGDISYKSLGVNGLQWSVDLGMGLEYRFLKFMGIYLDPKLTYYFYCDQPYSIRLEQPLQLNLNLGFRFHL